jgi:peptide/nickel transport system ATP-binding protein
VKTRATRRQARHRALTLLAAVQLHNPALVYEQYTFELSGGMLQRVLIAAAIAADPTVLIADEATTALDVTVQAEILDLIRDLQREFNSAVILITHDLGVVAELADDILVMYAGRSAEYGSARSIFRQPQHPYTWGLLSSMPRLDREPTERLLPITGTPPSLINVPSGCAFHPRCAYASLTAGRSQTERPASVAIGGGHYLACHLTAQERDHAWTTEVRPTLGGQDGA